MTLHDPPQLARLVGGELPGFPDERRLRDRRPSIDVLWKVLALKLSGVRWLTVCHGVPRSRQGDHECRHPPHRREGRRGLASFSLGDAAAQHRQAARVVPGCCQVVAAASSRTLVGGLTYEPNGTRVGGVHLVSSSSRVVNDLGCLR
jgi:hypothetical protein